MKMAQSDKVLPTFRGTRRVCARTRICLGGVLEKEVVNFEMGLGRWGQFDSSVGLGWGWGSSVHFG